jgi:hypothetical protein
METKNEIWKPIKDYEGLYEVSNFGRVRSVGRWIEIPHPRNPNYVFRYFHKGQLISQHIHNNGYMHVILYKERERKGHTNLVHRLVAMAFIPGYQKGMDVNHKDCNRVNNNVDNLEWMSRRDNLMYAGAMDRIHKNQRVKVKQLTLSGELVKIWPSIHRAHLELGIDSKSITGCCRGYYGNKTAGGYRWQFADD